MFSVCKDAASSVAVTVQHDVWDGEGAWLRCTWQPSNADTTLLYWFKNSVTAANGVYIYDSGVPAGTKAYTVLENRAVGRRMGNVHELYINRTRLTDEDVYICILGTITARGTLTVGGEYS